MALIKINDRVIGYDQKPFIVVEAGINHNGELENAFNMISIAKKSGADAIKFQTFKASEFISDSTQLYTYISQGKQKTESMLEMFKRYEFTPNEWKQIKEKSDHEGICFFSTPQNLTDLDLLLELGIKIIKVGSDDLTNLPLLHSYSETGLPLILSCGMSNLAEVYQALETVGALDGYPTILLLCTSQYPTPPEDVHLRKLQTLSSAFPTIPMGFSDHTQGSLAASLALALGACFFEKHFTLDRNLHGPDHCFSANPKELNSWIQSINKSYIMMGSSIVRPTLKEKTMRNLARRSIVSIRDIQKGELFTTDNICLKRPGNGLSPATYNTILGLKATHDLPIHTVLKFGDFES